MRVEDIVNRKQPPLPWVEGDKIPWYDPDFSERMLKEHLSQQHDLASRREEKIDLQVSWIHKNCLWSRPSRVLDLGCGPGLYLDRLAKLGHNCVGIDFSPASIAYAQAKNRENGEKINYILSDIRNTDYGTGFDLIMLIYGEFNMFRSEDAENILRKSHNALNTGGCILLEPQTHHIVKQVGEGPATWRSESAGLFSPRPHLWLQEHFWHNQSMAATTRYFVIDAGTGSVQSYASTTMAYTDTEYEQLLSNAGFSHIRRHPSLAGTESHRQEGLCVLTAEKARDI